MGLFSFSDEANQAVMESFRKTMADAGAVPIPELVRQVHGASSSDWHDAATKATGLVDGHNQAGDRASKMLQRLESSWTGDGAEAASRQIHAGAKATQTSSEVYGANARQYTDNAHAFDNLKAQLTPMEGQAPERNAWDTLTPWDTDTEDKVNQYNAQLEQNRQAYQAYEQTMKSSQSGVRQDFGDASSLGGGFGDVSIDNNGADKNGTGHSTGIKTFDESSSSSQTNPPGDSAVSPAGNQGSVNVPSPGGGPTSPAPNLPGSTPGNDPTTTSSYTPPNGTAPAASTSNSQLPGFNPSTGFGPNSGGGNSSYSTTGFGPGAGFGPNGSSTGTGSGKISGSLGGGSGSGSGGAGSGGGRLTGGGAGGAAGGGVGAGKGTGAGPLGAAGQGSTGAGGTAAGGSTAAGRAGGGMGAMGGGAGSGKGTEDEEHQRRFVQSDDEAFALTEDGEVLRDPETGHVVTPPTIGG